MSTPTRDRILDAAITLFGERGFKGTSVTEIEAAAGLTPGAGGIFHHFKSKQALLEAGITRQLARVEAVREIRRVVGDVGDVPTQLTIMARYALAELDEESALVRLLVVEARNQPTIAAIVDEQVGSGLAEFAGWLLDRSELTPDEAAVVASLALGSLFAPRLAGLMLGSSAHTVDDAVFVPAWVHSVLLLLENPPAG